MSCCSRESFLLNLKPAASEKIKTHQAGSLDPATAEHKFQPTDTIAALFSSPPLDLTRCDLTSTTTTSAKNEPVALVDSDNSERNTPSSNTGKFYSTEFPSTCEY